VIRRPLSVRWTIALGVLSALLLLGAYAAMATWQKQRNPTDTTIPNLTQFVDGAKRVFQSRTVTTAVELPDGSFDDVSRTSWFHSWFWIDASATWLRLAVGLGLGAGGGILLGLLMGCFTPIAALLGPPLDFLAKVPPTAMLAIFFVAVGVGFNMYVAMIAFGVLPTLTQGVYTAARKGVPQELIDKASTLGASSAEVVFHVIAKQALPAIIEGARLCIGPAMVYLIAAEMALGDAGFGYRIRMQMRLQDMAVVYLYLVLLGFAGVALDYAFRTLLARLCPWYVKLH
jgi:NitT/TauT family transport system permease protein